MTGTLSDTALDAIRNRNEIARALDNTFCPVRALIRHTAKRPPLKLRLQSSTCLSNK